MSDATISRRAILTGIPAAAIGIGALAAPAMAFEPDTDAELVALDAEFGRIYREWIRDLASDENSEKSDDLLEQWSEVYDRMVAIKRVTSIRGAAVKVTAIFIAFRQTDEMVALWNEPESGLEYNLRIPLQFVNEMRSAAGLGPSPIQHI